MTPDRDLLVQVVRDDSGQGYTATVARSEGEAGPWFSAEGTSRPETVDRLIEMIAAYAKRQGWSDFSINTETDDGKSLGSYTLRRHPDWATPYEIIPGDESKSIGA